jgi:glycosyltransferase involved in cell wall biosynthesis
MRSFSIIIPFKTVKHYLSACIESVLAQTYPNYQIIVLTDHTSNDDGSIDYLYALNNPKIEVITDKGTLDILENWSRILTASHCEYMTILGYDDILHPHFLATINLLIDEHNDASLFHTHFEYIDSNGEVLNKCKPLPLKLNSVDYLSMSLNDQISIMATGYVFKTADYIKIGGIDTRYPNLIYADLQLWIDLIDLKHLVTSPDSCFNFRLHASTTKTSKDKTLIEALMVFVNYLTKLKNRSANYKQVINEHAGAFLEQTTKSIAHRLLRTPVDLRQGLTINEIVEKLSVKANEVGVDYNPHAIRSFKMAVLIEKSKLLSWLFLQFKRIYNKPIYQ